MKSALLVAAAIVAAAIAHFAGRSAGKTPVSGDKFSQTLRPAAAQKRLTGALAEVSGLAIASETTVYAHNDEQAVIYELDVGSGKVLRTISLGRPAVAGDFEALAANDGALSLITSAGVIYKAMVEPGRSIPFRTLDTGLGRECEIEGFAPAEGVDVYLVACKRAKGRLVVYKWGPETGAAKLIDLKLDGVVPNPNEFRAGDIVSDKTAGTLLVLDSSAGAILEVSMKGQRLGYWRLGGNHPQAEGLALLKDGKLLVADEGRIGHGSLSGGVLTLYPPRR